MDTVDFDRDAMFSGQKEKLAGALLKEEAVSGRYSRIRTAVFLLAVFFFALGFRQGEKILFFVLAAISILFFVGTVWMHSRNKRKIRELSLLIQIHGEHESRIIHDFSALSDDGHEFLNADHDFSADLDLFGKGSLFHLLNVGSTWHGRNRLFFLLSSHNEQPSGGDEIRERQAAVAELSRDICRIENLQCAARLSGQNGKDPGMLIAYADGRTSAAAMDKRLLFLFFSLSLSLLATAVLAFAFSLIPVVIPFSLFCVQILITAFFYRKNRETFSSVDDFYRELSSYTRLFERVEQAEFSSESLKKIQRVFLSPENESGSASLRNRKLRNLATFIHLRSQPILFLFLNALFLYDSYCIYFLEKWKRENGKELESYLQALGEMEALSSLSVMRFIFPEACFPDIEEKKSVSVGFWAEEMGHPLIPTDRMVSNSISLDGGIALITGSNMSGKTTLLRTVGINAVLSYAGTVCCAGSLRLPVMRIGSSMRIADDLGEGLSTFYAELLRVGRIIRQAESGVPLLFLIDEIFRGTNSRDRTDGAVLVLQKLSDPGIMGFMSTHDYALCSLEESSPHLRHFHFSEWYDENGIHFDYRLAPGISISSNARYLMKLMGIE